MSDGDGQICNKRLYSADVSQFVRRPLSDALHPIFDPEVLTVRFPAGIGSFQKFADQRVNGRYR